MNVPPVVARIPGGPSTRGHFEDHVTLAVAVNALGDVVKEFADAAGIPAVDVELALRGIPEVVQASFEQWASNRAVREEWLASQVTAAVQARRTEVRMLRLLTALVSITAVLLVVIR